MTLSQVSSSLLLSEYVLIKMIMFMTEMIMIMTMIMFNEVALPIVALLQDLHGAP